MNSSLKILPHLRHCAALLFEPWAYKNSVSAVTEIFLTLISAAKVGCFEEEKSSCFAGVL